jgi:Fe-S-cluster containining protein
MEVFKCITCGECCYGEGGIFMEAEEIEKISRFLRLSREKFLSQACEKRHERWYIRTGSDGYCLYFHQEKNCLIHPVKPGRCRLWPFFAAIVDDPENWELAKEACPGINPDCTFEAFVKKGKR